MNRNADAPSFSPDDTEQGILPMPTLLSTPKINLNGTNAADLITEYRAASDAVSRAHIALAGVTCHGRDGLDSVDRAKKSTCLERLQEISDALEFVLEGLYEQNDARKRR